MRYPSLLSSIYWTMLSRSPQVYCDTSLIIEVLEHTFSQDHLSVYPPAADGKTNRALIRGFASHWTDVSAGISSLPTLVLTRTASLLPRNDWSDTFECLAYAFRHRPRRPNWPQARSEQTRSENTSKSLWARLAPGMKALLLSSSIQIV
jgi:hypothetical protein